MNRRTVLGLCCTLPLCIAGMRSQSCAGEPRSHALLIGIQSYGRFGQEWSDLDGPFHDIELVSDVLVRRLGFAQAEIHSLLDPTRAEIVAAFERLIAATQPDDVVYIHYSGHGSRVADANGDEEAERFDSTLVPIDARESAQGEILDDELAIWLHRLRQRTSQVTLVVDACHSGTITRGDIGLKTRQAPSLDTRSYNWSQSLSEELESIHGAHTPDRFVRLSACLDTETAKEFRSPDDRIYGLLTWTWCQALLRAEPTDSYRDVVQRVQALMYQERGSLQHAQLEGDAASTLLGARMTAPSNALAVREVAESFVSLDAGALHGVTVGSVYRTRGQAESSTSIEITQLHATTSEGRILAGPTPQVADLFEETKHAFSLAPLGVCVVAAADASMSFVFELERTIGVDSRFAPKSAAQADLLLEVGASEIALLDARGEPLTEGLLATRMQPLDPRAGVAAVITELQRQARRRDLLSIIRSQLSTAPGVSVELVGLQVVDCGSSRQIAAAGGECFGAPEVLITANEDVARLRVASDVYLTFHIENQTGHDRYFYLFNFDPSGRVQQFFPGRGGFDSVAQLQVGAARIPAQLVFRLDEADRAAFDTYVWFITDEPVDLSMLTGGTTRSSGATELESLLLQIGGATTRGANATKLEPEGLATRAFVIEVASPASR